MIDSKIALAHFHGLTPQEVRGEFDDAFLRGKGVGAESRWIDEPPEDIFISALRDDSLPAEIRGSIIAGCTSLYIQFFAFLTSTCEQRDTRRDGISAYMRLCRLVDFAQPEELAATAKSMIKLALDIADLDIILLGPLARATMKFGQTESDIPTWEAAITQEPLAAYAFNALLSIDPQHHRMKGYLRQLWQQASEGWNVNPIFLTRRLSKAQDSDRVAVQVLREVADELPEFWSIAKEKLQQTKWGVVWLEKMMEPESHIYKVMEKNYADWLPVLTNENSRILHNYAIHRTTAKETAKEIERGVVSWREGITEQINQLSFGRYEKRDQDSESSAHGVFFNVGIYDFTSKKVINQRLNECVKNIENDLGFPLIDSNTLASDPMEIAM